MEGLELMGLNLPYFVLITIFFSYLIWSKFLKNKGLSPKDIHDVFDILNLFAFFFISLLSFSIFILLLSSLFVQFVEITRIWEAAKSGIAFTVTVIIFLLINLYRNKEVSKDNLKEITNPVIIGHFFIIILFLGFWILILSTALRYILYDMIILLPMIILLILIVNYIAYTLFKTSLVKEVFQKNKLKIILPILLVIIIILGFFFIPQVKYGEPQHLMYYIYDPDQKFGEAYLESSQPIHIDILPDLKVWDSLDGLA